MGGIGWMYLAWSRISGCMQEIEYVCEIGSFRLDAIGQYTRM